MRGYGNPRKFVCAAEASGPGQHTTSQHTQVLNKPIAASIMEAIPVIPVVRQNDTCNLGMNGNAENDNALRPYYGVLCYYFRTDHILSLRQPRSSESDDSCIIGGFGVELVLTDDDTHLPVGEPGLHMKGSDMLPRATCAVPRRCVMPPTPLESPNSAHIPKQHSRVRYGFISRISALITACGILWLGRRRFGLS